MRELIIDLDAIASNLKSVRARVGSAMVLGVVKADAYGHGMIPVAKKLEAAGVDYLGVADVHEAQQLRDAGIDLPILAWLHDPRENFIRAIDSGIELGIANLEQLERVAKAAEHLGRIARVHLKVDTGLGRNGSTEQEWPALLKAAHGFVAEGFIQAVAIFSHLSCTSEADDLLQIERFDAACQNAHEHEIDFELRHLTASDGSIRYPQAHYEMVRIGVALYGLSPFTENHSEDFGLIPAMTATSVVCRPSGCPLTMGSVMVTSTAPLARPLWHWCQLATPRVFRETLALPPKSQSTARPIRSLAELPWINLCLTSVTMKLVLAT